MKLWQQVVIGMVLGVIAGVIFKEGAENLKPLGTLFINLIKMVVVPLIFFALLAGITNMSDGKNLSRVGIKGIIAYLGTASFAVIIGLAAGTIFQPGVGISLDLSSAAPAASAGDHAVVQGGVVDILLGLIPTNIFKAMADDHFLQIIVFALFTGFTVNSMGDSSKKIKELIQESAKVTFKMIETIVKIAPIGVFGFISWLVGTQGMDILISLGKLVVTVLVACAFQYVLFGVMIAVFGRLSPFPFYRKIMEAQALAFATSSSKATLSTAMRILQDRLGVSKAGTNFLMPLGACINMDGTAIYLGICALFFAQATGHVLTGHDYMMLILTCTLGSIGAAGIPSGSIIFMGMVLSSVGLPIEGIGIILGVDRILDMVRTTINITGDATITLVVDRSEKMLDEKQYYAPATEIIILDSPHKAEESHVASQATAPHVVIDNTSEAKTKQVVNS